ncbi:MAG: hypothetical protein KKA70_00395 [Proteobacteria bacterium]|nr:hypothetical protein [Pseudomonadota bacterium]
MNYYISRVLPADVTAFMKQRLRISCSTTEQKPVNKKLFFLTLPLLLVVFFLLQPIPAAARLTQANSPFTIDEKSLLHFYVENCVNSQVEGMPAKASYNSTTGLFTWLPDYGDAGNYTLTVSCDAVVSSQVNIVVQSIVPTDKTTQSPQIVLVGSSSWMDSESENDQKSLAAMFDVYNFSVATEPDIISALASGTTPDILVIPWNQATVLSSADIAQVVAFVNQGGNLLITGRTALAEELGITYDNTTVQVGSFTDYLNPGHDFVWSAGETLEVFTPETGDTIFTIDKDTGAPITIGRKIGPGRLIYVGSQYYDHYSNYGTKGHPYLLYHFIDYLKIRLMIAGPPPLDAYFDPGNYDLSVIYVEDLINVWAEQGITTVYAAAWHFWVNTDTGVEWTFDYENFIATCHKRGIMVYAWFAFPHVSQRFWEQNPSCREQTALNGENYDFWRLGVNLQNPACLQLTLAFVDDLINAYDWDGVNIAELYYDYQNNVATFTPMNQDVRTDYQALQGIDPAEFFDPASSNYYLVNTTEWQRFLDYRTDLVTGLHDTFLSAAGSLTSAKGQELVLTAVDSLHYDYFCQELPAMAYLADAFETGVDLPAIVAMMSIHDFTLQVEDPWLLWNLNPMRYGYFNETYLSSFAEISGQPERLFFDVNLDIHAHNPLAESVPMDNFISAKQTGIEVPITLKNMYFTNNRLAFFSEKSIESPDLERLEWALAADTQISKINEASYTVTAQRTAYFVPPVLYNKVLVNGQNWPGWSAVDHRILVPPGTYSIELQIDQYYDGIKIIGVNAALTTAEVETGGLAFTYDSPRHKAVITVEAFSIDEADAFIVYLDGSPYTPTIASFYGHYYFFLPSGSHTVRILTSESGANPADDDTRCFIATAAYGSYLEDEVIVLRNFRDRYLKTNRPGLELVNLYYRLSPAAAAYLQDKEALRWMVRCMLTPVVYAIQLPGRSGIVVLLVFSVFCFYPLRRLKIPFQ